MDGDGELPVRLEYSTDGGIEWQLVVANHQQDINPHDRAPFQPSTIYYSTTHGQWQRETVLLSHLDANK